MRFASQDRTENSMLMRPPSDICVNYCSEGNCTDECRSITGNQPFRINNIMNGTNYTVSLSLRNDFGQSGQTTPELFGKAILYVVCKAIAFLLWICIYVVCIIQLIFDKVAEK